MQHNPTAPADIISPAEAQFWQEQAGRVPSLLREMMGKIPTDKDAWNISNPWKVLGVGAGAALGAFSFSNSVAGKWKWVARAAAAGSVVAGFYVSKVQNLIMCGIRHSLPEVVQAMEGFVDKLEQDPGLKQQLADYLSAHVTARDIQKNGLDQAVMGTASEFATVNHLLDIENMGQRVHAKMLAEGCISR